MNHQAAPTSSTPEIVRPVWRRRWLARGLWLALVVPTLAIFAASLPEYLALVRTACGNQSHQKLGDAASYGCSFAQLSPQQAAALHSWGFSLSDYANFNLALTLVLLAVCLSVSILIVWRRPDDPMAVLIALMLITVGAVEVLTTLPVNSSVPIPNASLYVVFVALLVLSFSLFPNGHFVPRWTRWSALVCIAAQVPYAFFYAIVPAAPFATKFLANGVAWLALLGELAILIVAQVYRYRRVSTPLERQQTKWVIVGLGLPAGVAVLGEMLGAFALTLNLPDSPVSAYYLLVYNVFLNGSALCLPVSFGFAMLRYRLWDIDVLIRRTLVYGTLSFILTAIYASLVIGLQSLLSRADFVHQDSTLAIVISTLAIAALFQPLRRRIRRIIDRRFYRRMYDAAQILSAFGATLRQEMDLEQLHGQVLAVVQETMQPTQVSLWLRPTPKS